MDSRSTFVALVLLVWTPLACNDHSTLESGLNTDASGGEGLEGAGFCEKGGQPYPIRSAKCRGALDLVCFIGEPVGAARDFEQARLTKLAEFRARNNAVLAYPNEEGHEKFLIGRCSVESVEKSPYTYRSQDMAAVACLGSDAFDQETVTPFTSRCASAPFFKTYCYIGPESKARKIIGSSKAALKPCKFESL